MSTCATQGDHYSISSSIVPDSTRVTIYFGDRRVKHLGVVSNRLPISDGGPSGHLVPGRWWPDHGHRTGRGLWCRGRSMLWPVQSTPPRGQGPTRGRSRRSILELMEATGSDVEWLDRQIQLPTRIKSELIHSPAPAAHLREERANRRRRALVRRGHSQAADRRVGRCGLLRPIACGPYREWSPVPDQGEVSHG